MKNVTIFGKISNMDKQQCTTCKGFKTLEKFDMISDLSGKREDTCFDCKIKKAEKYGRKTDFLDVEYMCYVCFEFFPTRHIMDTHYHQEHDKDTPYTCQYCGKKFKRNNDGRGKHEKRCNGEEKVKCPECDTELSCQRALDRHIIAKHKPVEERPYECEICQKRFTTPQQLTSHLRIHEEKEPKFVCEICKHKSNSDENLEIHKEYTHYGRIDYCPYKDCKFNTKCRGELNRHITDMHQTVAIFTCRIDDCEEKENPFVGYSHRRFRQHFRSVHLNKKVLTECIAEDCNRIFTSEQNMKQHLKMYHNPDRYLQCPDCEFRITKSKQIIYDSHIRIHQNVEEPKKYCKMCNLNLAESFFDKRFKKNEKTCNNCKHCNMRQRKGRKKCPCGVGRCKIHTPSLFCDHGKEKYTCKDCNGTQICTHGRVKSICADCGGGSICIHNIERKVCKICNPCSHLLYIVRRRINSAMKRIKKGKKTLEYLGCSSEFYYEYLEEKFDEHMSWDNYGTYWHIDHIIPIKYKKNGIEPTEKEIIERLHYTNTQPMEKGPNMSKGNRWIG